MSLLSRQELESLLEAGSEHRVSLFLPTHRAGLEYQKDPIRLKNLLRQAEALLVQDGLNGKRAQAFLEPARRLLDDDDFWQHQSDGLAIFLSEDFFRRYRLPRRFDEQAILNTRFYVKPLLPLLTGDGRFYLLAISQNRVRLFEGTQHTIREVDLRDIPESLRDAVGYDWEEQTLQFHTGAGPGPVGGHGRRAMFHGQGAPDDDVKDEIAVFFHRVDDGLLQLLRDQQPPLVVAAVDYEIPIYRSVSKYPNLLEKGVEGNPDIATPAELHKKAWRLVEPIFTADRERAADRYRALLGTGKASQDLREVVPAAFDGRVAELFVAVDEHRWGRFDPESRELRVDDRQRPGNEDLLDLAAIQSLVQGATVYASEASEIPGGGPLAAIYRY